jgi:phosphoserine phosphatase
LLFAVSGSQAEIVEIVARHYGFDGWAGSVYHQENGKFNGQKTILAGQLKVDELEKLIKKHGAAKGASVAVGDTDGDIAVLEAVERPIAFNPNKKLFEHAKSHGWQVVVERKNMIYQLEPGQDGYKLA